LPVRHERLIPHGPVFKTLSGLYRLYEAPHGVLASKSRQLSASPNLKVTQGHSMESLLLGTLYAKEEYSDKDGQSSLAMIVRAWSTFFDNCLDKYTMLDWGEMGEYLKTLLDEKFQEPRMALIVKLAEAMKVFLAEVVRRARRILLRERELLPAGRVAELDGACLNWYIRQPGETSVQKAAVNRQRLMGVDRRESYDTLENRVLLDFLRRCDRESQHYLNTEVVNNAAYQRSTRASDVRHYRNICAELSKDLVFIHVAALATKVRPNYVLQNDVLYRKVWQNYQRLLRQEDEEDRSWDWQSRTWADLARMLLNVALCSMEAYFIKPLLKASLKINKEQLLGQRLVAGTEPGPFALLSAKGEPKWILEVVHPDQAGQHPVTQKLGRLGGHLYYVLNRINSSEKRVLVVWAIHCASSKYDPNWGNVSDSAFKALEHHYNVLSDHNPYCPKLYGLVAASYDRPDNCDTKYGKHNLPVLRLPTDYRRWSTALTIVIKPTLELQLEVMCS
jgi:hypothetical protein